MGQIGSVALGLALALVIPTAGHAQQVAAAAASSTKGEAAAFGSANAVTESDLKASSGRADIGTQIASATQRNTVADNSVTGNSVTGNVAIDGNAFQNVQGLAVINANSGNNVAINAAMNVTINLAPKP